MATPTFDVEFTKDGDIFRQPQIDALLAGLLVMRSRRTPLPDLAEVAPE